MGKGKRFELDTKNALNENTKPWVKSHRPDFSGSSTGEVADIMVVWQAERYEPQRPRGHPERFVAYGELKKRSGKEGNRTTVMSGSSQDESGLDELHGLLLEAPDWTEKFVGIKFPNRELIVLEANALLSYIRQDDVVWGTDEEYIDDMMDMNKFEPRLTPSDNISMKMPELDWWPSQSAGKEPWKKLALSIGLEEYDFNNV